MKSFAVQGSSYANTYDANGNLTKEGISRHFVWGASDKLVAFANKVGSAAPTVFTWYFYNAQGERVKKLTKKGTVVEGTVYIDGGMFETTYTKPTGGAIDANLHYNTLQIKDGTSQIATIRVGTNTPDSTPAVKYYLADHLENSTVVLRTNGSMVNREEYYPFGETSFGSYKYKRYRYNGKEKDEHTGLYEYGQRYYAPWLCRFVSVDPIAEKFADLSSYNYAGNRPITKVDQDGLQEKGRSETSSGGQSEGGTQLLVENGLPTVNLPPVEITGVSEPAISDTEIMEADNLRVDLGIGDPEKLKSETFAQSADGPNGMGEFIDKVGSLMEKIDGMLYPDGGVRLTSDNAPSSDGGAVKRNYDYSQDVSDLQAALMGLGKNPKALNADRMGKILSGLEALSGAVGEAADNKELIHQKIQDVYNILNGISGGRDQIGVEPSSSEAPQVGFKNGRKEPNNDSIIVTSYLQVALYQTYPEFAISKKDTSNNTAWIDYRGVRRPFPIISAKPKE